MGSCFGRCLIDSSNRNQRSSTSDVDAEQCKNLVEESSNSPVENNFIYRIMKTKEKRHSKFIERFWARRNNVQKEGDTTNMRYSRLDRSAKNKPVAVDIPLQNLDAHSLLLTTTTYDKNAIYRPGSTNNSSPTSSSLDLEWEHEYGNGGHHNKQSWLILPEEYTAGYSSCSSGENSFCNSADDLSCKNTSNQKNIIQNNTNIKLKQSKTNKTSSWSHISTPESLEWDVNDADDENVFLKSAAAEEENCLLDNETMELLQEIEWLKNRALNETGENCRDSHQFVNKPKSAES